jgi:HlyD family secretion protein
MNIPVVRRETIAAFVLLALTACRKPAPADAYGNFEAEEVVVSAEASGQLVRFDVAEGAHLSADSVIAMVDTVVLALERAQLLPQRASLVARRAEGMAQVQGLEVQRDIARRTRERIDRLFANQAATATQRDQVERDDRLLAAQVSGARDGVRRAAADIAALDARMASLQDRIRRARVKNPVTGTVLATYARTGEMVAPGQPLYRIANLDTLTLRMYVSGAQLTTFRIGTLVQVHTDGNADASRAYTGTISWVSAKAEFTPTPVQTREARGDLVYAVKARVANRDGTLKVGMPADVTLPRAPSATQPPVSRQ